MDDCCLRVKTDIPLMIVVSFLLAVLFISIGILFFVFLHNIAGVITGIIFLFFGGLPFCAWRRGFSRELLLYKDKVIFKQGAEELTYGNNTVKAITAGNHVVLYLNNGRRRVIFWVSLPKCKYLEIRNTLVFFGSYGDLRVKKLNKFAVCLYLILFILSFVAKTDMIIPLSVVAIIAVMQFIYWLINYLFCD